MSTPAHVVYGIVGLLALLQSACSPTKTLVVLLPEDNGKAGVVSVGKGTDTTLLDTPLTAARVDAHGHARKKAIAEPEVRRIFASTLGALPTAAVSFTLYFEEGGMALMQESQATLAALLAEVAKRDAVEVQVTGHTDRMGSEAMNDRLSLQRAESVRDLLVKEGLHTKFIRVVGRGEREPLVPTPDEQVEPRNRRVEVIVR